MSIDVDYMISLSLLNISIKDIVDIENHVSFIRSSDARLDNISKIVDSPETTRHDIGCHSTENSMMSASENFCPSPIISLNKRNSSMRVILDETSENYFLDKTTTSPVDDCKLHSIACSPMFEENNKPFSPCSNFKDISYEEFQDFSVDLEAKQNCEQNSTSASYISSKLDLSSNYRHLNTLKYDVSLKKWLEV